MVLMLVLAAASTVGAAPAKSETKRMSDAASVIRELRSAPDRRIPESVWDRARCVAVMPDVKKAAFVLSGGVLRPDNDANRDSMVTPSRVAKSCSATRGSEYPSPRPRSSLR
jgi:lipid-binding SYLF domain-containing protein